MRKIVMHIWITLVFSIVFWNGVIAYALTLEDKIDTNSPEFVEGVKKGIVESIDKYVDVPEGAVDWKIIGKTKEVYTKIKMEDGYDNEYYKPEFLPEVKALDGKEIKIKGFMFPMEAGETQKKFLFGPFPMSCPFHYHAGPSLTFEVHADANPVKFSYDPVTLTGKLELVPDDPDYGTFYRLKDAKEIK